MKLGNLGYEDIQDILKKLISEIWKSTVKRASNVLNNRGKERFKRLLEY